MSFICSSLYPVLYLVTLIIYSEAVPVARTLDEGGETSTTDDTYTTETYTTETYTTDPYTTDPYTTDTYTTEENEWRDDESHTKDVDTQTELSNCKEDLESYKRALELEASKPQSSAPQNHFLILVGKIEQNFLHLSLPPDHKPAELSTMKLGSDYGRGYVAKYHHCGGKGGCEEGRKDDEEEDEEEEEERHEWIDEEHLIEELEKEMEKLLEGLKEKNKGGKIENIEVEKMYKEEED